MSRRTFSKKARNHAARPHLTKRLLKALKNRIGKISFQRRTRARG